MKKFLSVCLAALMIASAVSVAAFAAAADWTKGNGFNVVEQPGGRDTRAEVEDEKNTPVTVTDNADGTIRVSQGGYFQNAANWGGVSSKDTYDLNGLEVEIKFEKVPELAADLDGWIAVDFLKNAGTFDPSNVAGNPGFMSLIRFNKPYVQVMNGLSDFSAAFDSQTENDNSVFAIKSGDTLKVKASLNANGLYDFIFTEYRGIKSWSYDERPREKMLQKGAGYLSNAELLAILIATGTKKQTAIDLARLLLAKSQNSLLQLGKFSPMELSSLTKGIGMAKAVTIAAALEIGRRRSDELPSQQIVFSSSEQVASVFRPMLADLPHEEFWILLLSRTNKAIAKYRVAVGGVHQTTVDVRVVLKHALLHLASAVVLCHNHPSGSRMPSLADKTLTKQIIEAARWMEIKILDHIIIAGDSYYSFSDENTLTL